MSQNEVPFLAPILISLTMSLKEIDAPTKPFYVLYIVELWLYHPASLWLCRNKLIPR